MTTGFFTKNQSIKNCSLFLRVEPRQTSLGNVRPVCGAIAFNSWMNSVCKHSKFQTFLWFRQESPKLPHTAIKLIQIWPIGVAHCPSDFVEMGTSVFSGRFDQQAQNLSAASYTNACLVLQRCWFAIQLIPFSGLRVNKGRPYTIKHFLNHSSSNNFWVGCYPCWKFLSGRLFFSFFHNWKRRNFWKEARTASVVRCSAGRAKHTSIHTRAGNPVHLVAFVCRTWWKCPVLGARSGRQRTGGANISNGTLHLWIRIYGHCFGLAYDHGVHLPTQLSFFDLYSLFPDVFQSSFHIPDQRHGLWLGWATAGDRFSGTERHQHWPFLQSCYSADTTGIAAFRRRNIFLFHRMKSYFHLLEPETLVNSS